MFKTKNPTLIIIDVQLAIDHFPILNRSNPEMEQAISNTLAKWRALKHPVIHVRHSSKSLESPYHKSSKYYEFKDAVKPLFGETIITKHENSAFIQTNLDETLKAMGVKEIVVCGVLSNHSIDATVRVGAGFTYDIFVPFDLTAAGSITLCDKTVITSEDVQKIFLSNLDGEYCRVCDSVELLANL